MKTNSTEPGTETESATEELEEGAQKTATGLIVYPPKEGHKRAHLRFVGGGHIFVDEDHHDLAKRLEEFERNPELGYLFPLVDASNGETVYLSRATVHEMVIVISCDWIRNAAPKDASQGGRQVELAGPGDIVRLNRADRRRRR